MTDTMGSGTDRHILTTPRFQDTNNTERRCTTEGDEDYQSDYEKEDYKYELQLNTRKRRNSKQPKQARINKNTAEVSDSEQHNEERLITY